MTSPDAPDAGDDIITSLAELEDLYGEPVPRSLTKELDYISPLYRRFIEAADEPFDGAAYDRNYPEHLRKTIY